MVLALAIVAWRIVVLSWFQHATYAEIARSQSEGVRNVLLRGNIYLSDSNGRERLVATNKKFPVLLIAPLEFSSEDSRITIAELASVSGASVEAISAAVTSGASGVRVVQKKLTDQQVKTIEMLRIPGVSIGYETDRSYPSGLLAADAIGFLGYSSTGRSGQYGVESSYEEQLTGHAPQASRVRWKIWEQLFSYFGFHNDGTVIEDSPNDLILSLDSNIQEYAQAVLTNVLKKYQAASGTLIVQDPQTGKILALADNPTYNPNAYGGATTESFRIGALSPFEPGSSMKPFTIAMGLERQLITPETTFLDSGDVVVDGYNIKNYNEGHFGLVTMTRILEKSINTGVMWVQQKVGNESFRDFTVNFGFGQQTGVDLPGESSGDISNLYRENRIYFMTASFGQGITVTPLQLISGYSAIANGGSLMRPYIVDAIRDAHGVVTKTQPKVMGTPISPRTAAQLRAMLTSVVDNGFDKARIPRYDVAGKTGTAQIASPTGGYLENQYNHSFVGFAPASNPRFVILIRMEKPKGITFAADSLSPAFRDMAKYLLDYMNIPPTR